MSTQDETAEESAEVSAWYGFDRLRLSDDRAVVDVTIGSRDRWDRAHLRKLRQSADLPGLVPVIDADVSSDGKPFAVTPAVDAPTLAEQIPAGSDWSTVAGITEAAARATHEAHMRGLFHGALSPDQIYVLGDDVAVEGIGLGLGGVPRADYSHWVAPEVLEDGEVTERSDVYSLGKILEAALGDSLEDVPRSVRRLIMWSGSDTPEARPPSALEFASILAEGLGDTRRPYGPAFIPTTEANDVASTASQSVAAHTMSESVPTESTGTPRAAASTVETAESAETESTGAVEMAAGAGAAAAAGAFSLRDRSESDGGDDAVEPKTEDDAEAAAESSSVEEPAAEPSTDSAQDESRTEEAPSIFASPVVERTPDESAVTTRQLTEEIGVGDLAAAKAEPVASDADYEVPAAAQTIDLDRPYTNEKKSNRALALIGGVLVVGLALIGWRLLQSNSETVDSAEVASASTEADATDEAAAPSTEENAEDSGAETTVSTESEAVSSSTADDSAAVAAESSTSTESTSTESTEADSTSTESTEAATSSTEAETTSTEAATSSTETGQASTTDTQDDVGATETSGAQSTADTGDDSGEPAESSQSSESSADAASAASFVDGPLSIEDAGLQLVHGIPGVPVDLYVDGKAVVPGFEPGAIAGPLDLAAGDYQVDLYAADESAAGSAADRTDEALLAGTVSVGTEPATVVAHYSADGEPTLSTFAEDFGRLAPGKSRLVVRHLAAAGAVNLALDGEAVDGALEPGSSFSVVVDAGSHTLSATDGDGNVVQEATLTLADGELADVSVIGSADGFDSVIQRFTGLGTAPSDIPTGTGGLLDGDTYTGLYLMAFIAALMAIGGGILLNRRNRVL